MPIQFRSLALAALAVSLFTACPRSEETTASPSASPSAQAAASPSLTHSGSPQQTAHPTGPTQGLQRGIFVYGEGYQTFKACGSKTEVWLEDTPQQDLQKRYLALKLMELEPVYVELEGSLKPTTGMEGFATDYPQALAVSRVVTLDTWWANNSCFATDFVAEGTRPDWTLQALSDGDVFFKSNEGEFPYVETLAYAPPQQRGNTWHYTFRYRTPQPESLAAELSTEACSFRGQDYPLTAKLTFRGMTYTGCARKF